MRCTGTHQGEWQGLAPTGRPMRIDEVYFFRFTDGRISGLWGLEDTWTRMQQLAGGDARARRTRLTQLITTSSKDPSLPRLDRFARVVHSERCPDRQTHMSQSGRRLRTLDDPSLVSGLVPPIATPVVDPTAQLDERCLASDEKPIGAHCDEDSVPSFGAAVRAPRGRVVRSISGGSGYAGTAARCMFWRT